MTAKARKRRELRSFRLVIVVSSAVTVLFLAWVGLGVGGTTVTELISNLVQAAAALVAAWACFDAASRNPYGFGRAWTASLHRAWRLLGSAALAWGLGQVVWTVLELRGGELPMPSLADAGFLTALPLLIAGVLAFPTAPMRATARLRTLLDGLLIAASLLFVGWAAVLGDAFRANASSTIVERAVCLAYPLGDIVAGAIVLVLLTRSRGRGVVHLSMIAAAVFSLLVADLGFAYKELTGSYSTGAMIDVGWVVGWLLLCATALKPTVAELRRSDDEDEPSITRLALPYAPLVVAAVTALIIQIVTGEFEPFLVYTGTMIGLLVISRQIVALIENRQLNARLRATVLQLSQREQELKDGLRRELAAADRLRAADAMKDTFLRAVSHDLRTPLTAMLGVAVTLERTRLNLPREQALDLVGMLVEKTRKLERLLKDLLDLNRLEEGVLEPNRSLTDVRELVHRVVTEVDQLAGWPIDIEAEPIQAFIDGPKVERIVENLLLNTTRHTPPGTRVWVKALA
ncbi:MAG TPA: histidine kinase dimerization/phospho-acceptor domain-containing protein, partial [Actinomycetes bacterium]|nr:histidine kinase dimerization/phospho-acceptor domain-containing protein [Actinomycetes bacterium]